jgi:hypothetical protein
MVRRRNYNAFKPNIIAMITDDLNKLSASNKTFEVKIRRMQWKDKKPLITYTPIEEFKFKR